MIGRGNLWKPKPTKFQNQTQKETTIERGNPCGDSEIPEWIAQLCTCLLHSKTTWAASDILRIDSKGGTTFDLEVNLPSVSELKEVRVKRGINRKSCTSTPLDQRF